jgi:thymidine kinase
MSQVSSGDLYIVTGPTSSGKSQWMFKEILDAHYGHQANVLALNHVRDTRDSTFSTNVEGFDTEKVLKGIEKFKVEFLSEVKDVSKYDVIFIDECHFFEQHKEFEKYIKHWVFNLGKCVRLFGLTTNYMGKSYKGHVKLHKLAKYARSYTIVPGVCRICRTDNNIRKSTGFISNAIYSARIIEGGNDQIDVGGSEKYAAMCSAHFVEHLNKTKPGESYLMSSNSL